MITITYTFVDAQIDGLELDYFGLRNWEPAPRVGVRRTIADCGFKIKEPGVRIQNSGEKQSSLSSSQLLATDYQLLLCGA